MRVLSKDDVFDEDYIKKSPYVVSEMVKLFWRDVQHVLAFYEWEKYSPHYVVLVDVKTRTAIPNSNPEAWDPWWLDLQKLVNTFRGKRVEYSIGRKNLPDGLYFAEPHIGEPMMLDEKRQIIAIEPNYIHFWGRTFINVITRCKSGDEKDTQLKEESFCIDMYTWEVLTHRNSEGVERLIVRKRTVLDSKGKNWIEIDQYYGLFEGNWYAFSEPIDNDKVVKLPTR